MVVRNDFFPDCFEQPHTMLVASTTLCDVPPRTKPFLGEACRLITGSMFFTGMQVRIQSYQPVSRGVFFATYGRVARCERKGQYLSDIKIQESPYFDNT